MTALGGATFPRPKGASAALAASALQRLEDVTVLNDHKREGAKILFLFDFSAAPHLNHHTFFSLIR